MKKNIFLSLVLAMLILLGIEKVNALPDSLTMQAEGTSVTLNSSLDVVTGTAKADAIYPWSHVKNSDQGTVVCLSGYDVQPAGAGVACTKSTSYSAKQAAGLAYIFDLINKTDATAVEKFYWQELLAVGYLGNLYDGVHFGPGSNTDNNIVNSSTKILSTGKSYSEILSAANSVDTSAATITANGGSVANLTFTLNANDGYYYSNEVTINSNSNYSEPQLNNSKFSYTKNGNKYTFKIKATDIEVGATESFTTTVNVSKSYKTSAQYSCGSYQAVGLVKTEDVPTSASITIKGSVTAETKSFSISKQDEYKNKIKGVVFELKTKAQYDANESGITKTTNGTDNLVFDNLNAGEYYLSEVEVPAGYIMDTTTYKIVIGNGKITVNGVEQDAPIIVIKNALTETVISKKSAVNSQELPGATLQILDKDKKEMSCKIKNSDGDIEELEICKWVSTDKPVSVMGLGEGIYYLKELIAPEGYVLNESVVQFEVKADGDVNEVEMVNELEVDVPDTLSARSALLLTIAMFDIALGIGIVTYVKKNKITE